jgi:cytochrome d ubiquinol oxidase subunit I
VAQGTSPTLSGGNVLFTLLGFAGIYLVLGLLFVVLVVQETVRGPSAGSAPPGEDASLSFY